MSRTARDLMNLTIAFIIAVVLLLAVLVAVTRNR